MEIEIISNKDMLRHKQDIARSFKDISRSSIQGKLQEWKTKITNANIGDDQKESLIMYTQRKAREIKKAREENNKHIPASEG